MNEGGCSVELRPDRLLLDPSFGGYKLSLDPIPIYRKTIDQGVQVIQPNDQQYSFYHVKLFSLHNHLQVNPWKSNSVYFIDKGLKVHKIVFSQQQLITLEEVFQIPNFPIAQKDNYNASFVFATSDLVVLSDGGGSLLMVNVTEQKNQELWTLVNSDKEDASFVLSDARVDIVDNKKTLNVALLFVEEKDNSEKDSKEGLFQTKLKWRTFVENSNQWEKKCIKELCVSGSVDYVALEPGCKSLYMISDKPPKWMSDSENPINTDMEVESEPEPKLYSWIQTAEEISVSVPLEKGTAKSDLTITVNDLNLEVKLKEKPIISGQFFHRVSTDLTTWSIEKNQLVIQLTKHENGLMWKCLIPGDNKGEEMLDSEFVKDVHNKLAHLCSDKEETSSGVSFNSQQLEDCDAISCDTSCLYRIKGETHSTTHKVSLSSLQWLFKVSYEPDEAPAICVRHDVDACVWQFGKSEDDKTWPHKHVGTFSAFGYVQASKTQKKFLTSPPNLSYVAICEASHHIYIYRQPSPLTTQLKNRFTGKKVDTISKQQLVNLEAKDHILGVHATNNFLFVLLETSICVLAVNV